MFITSSRRFKMFIIFCHVSCCHFSCNSQNNSRSFIFMHIMACTLHIYDGMTILKLPVYKLCVSISRYLHKFLTLCKKNYTHLFISLLLSTAFLFVQRDSHIPYDHHRGHHHKENKILITIILNTYINLHS